MEWYWEWKSCKQNCNSSKLSFSIKFSLWNRESSCALTIVVPLCFAVLHHKIEPKGLFFYRLCFGACKTSFKFIVTTHKTKCVVFLDSERRKLWKKYLVKRIPRSSLTTGQIRTIQTTERIEQISIITLIKSTTTAENIKPATKQTEETRCIFGLTGRLITPNTMIDDVGFSLFCW